MSYLIKPYVDKGFDFSIVFPEKQQAVKEASDMKFTLSEVVQYLQRQTNNFEIDNPVAKDLDVSVFNLLTKWEKTQDIPDAASTDTSDNAETPPIEIPEVQLPGNEVPVSESITQITEAIEALQYLADEGDEEAKEAIEALKYLLEMES